MCFKIIKSIPEKRLGDVGHYGLALMGGVLLSGIGLRAALLPGFEDTWPGLGPKQPTQTWRLSLTCDGGSDGERGVKKPLCIGVSIWSTLLMDPKRFNFIYKVSPNRWCQV